LPRDILDCIKQIVKLWLAYAEGFLAHLLHEHRDPLESEMPWLPFPTIGWLEKYIAPDMQVFEWGSGGSTAYIARRVKHVTSVEHHALWHAKVRFFLWLRGITNCNLVLKEPERAADVPERYRSTGGKTSHLGFMAYALYINRFPDNYFDLVVIDGRGRSACIMLANKKVKIGGYILLDDSERPEYRNAISSLTALNYRVTAEFKGHLPFCPADLIEESMVFQRLS
jgi:hypothetical protein